MRFVAYVLFLVFFILTAVLILGNLSYQAEQFFFLAPFQNKSLALPFFGFAILGMMNGVFFVLSLYGLFTRSDKLLTELRAKKDEPDHKEKSHEK